MEIIETHKDYKIRFPFDQYKLESVKNIPGAWYEGRLRTWHVPRSRLNEINRLRQKFHVSSILTDVPVIPEDLSSAPEMPDLDIAIPELKMTLRKYQEHGVAYNRQFKRVIMGDQPGLGKTIQAIATLLSYGVNKDNYLNAGPGLVICPASLKYNWQNEWMAAAGHRTIILEDKIQKTWQQYHRVGMADVFICNFESLKKYFIKPGWKKPVGEFKVMNIPFLECIQLFKWVIIDESHNLKDGSRQQTKFVMGITQGKELVFELTGTPVLNKTRDLISQLHIIDKLRDIVSHIPRPVDKNGYKTDYSGVRRFEERYCDGGYGSSNLKELNIRLMKHCFYRREKSDVLKDLPEKIRQVMRCEITNRPEYDQASKQFEKYLREVKGCSEEAVKKKMKAQMMVKIGILKQLAACGKIEAAKEYIDEVIAGGQKIVVFVHHLQIARAIKELYPQALTITGQDDKEARERSIHDFQKCNVCNIKFEKHGPGHAFVHSPSNIIICSLKAGGVGITLTAASELLFIEYPWTYGVFEQAEDRTHRISQVNQVRSAVLIGHKTIDEYCYYDILQPKKEMSQQVTGDSDVVNDEIIDKLFNLFNQK